MLFTSSVVKADADDDLEKWADGWSSKNGDRRLERYRYKVDGKEVYRYALYIPSPKECGVKTIVRSPSGSYWIQIMDGDTITKCVEIKLTAQYLVEGVGNRWFETPAPVVYTTGNENYLVITTAEKDGGDVVFSGGNRVDEDYFHENLDVWLTAKAEGVTPQEDRALKHGEYFIVFSQRMDS